MNRKIIPVSHPQLTSFDLEAFVSQAEALNQRNQAAFITSFPKHSSRWISRDQFHPRPITFTDKGAVEGGLSWFVGATLDFRFARDLCAGAYGARGGHCYDPASLVFMVSSQPRSKRRVARPLPQGALRPPSQCRLPCRHQEAGQKRESLWLRAPQNHRPESSLHSGMTPGQFDLCGQRR